jgi:DNA-binding NarL/FixJ family response regulator
MIAVFLADDHETVREGLQLLIDAQPDMEVISVVLDLGMPYARTWCAMRP